MKGSNKKLIVLYLNQNICCGYSKNASLRGFILLSTQSIHVNLWESKRSHFNANYIVMLKKFPSLDYEYLKQTNQFIFYFSHVF